MVGARREQARDEARARNIETYNLAGAVRAMVLSKHAPSFERLFPRSARRDPMSDEEMFRQVRALNRMLGGTED